MINTQGAVYQNNDKKLIKDDCLSTRPGVVIVLTDSVVPG